MKKVDFKALLEKNNLVISKICRVYSNDEEEFQDYFQEVCLQIWKSYDSFRGNAQLSTWIYRVALNVCLSELRKEKKRVNTYSLNPDFDQADEKEDLYHERAQRLQAAIKTLKKPDRAIILLYLEDKSYKEMAAILGITTSNIGVKLNRLKLELKEKLYAG